MRTARNDRLLLAILLAHLPVAIWLVPMGFGTAGFAAVASILVAAAAVVAFVSLRGTPFFGLVAGALLTLLSAILIQSQFGRFEMHPHIFIALACLTIYKRWSPIAMAAGLFNAHHLAFTALQLQGASLGGMPIMLFSYDCGWDTMALHLVFVNLAALILIYYAMLMRRDDHTAEQLIEAIGTIGQRYDLGIRVQDTSDDALLGGLDRLLQRFGVLNRDVAQAVTRIRSICQHIEDVAHFGELEHSARRERAAQASAAADSLARAVRQAAEEIGNAAAVAAAMNDTALESHERFNLATRSTTDLQRHMAESNQAIKELADQAAELDHVVEEVWCILELLDRLALEAAIAHSNPASSPPQTPRLADALAVLARHTQNAATTIREQVERTRRASAEVVDRNDRAQRHVKEGSGHLLQAGMALNEVLESLGRISDIAAGAASGIAPLPRTADDMTRHIASLMAHEEHVARANQSNLDSATKLRRLADALHRLVAEPRHG